MSTIAGGAEPQGPSEPTPAFALVALELFGRLPGHFITLSAANGRVLYASRSVVDVLGIDQQTYAATLRERVHPEDLPAALRALEQVVRDAAGDAHLDVRMCHADGSWRWVECLAVNALDVPGIEAIVWNNRDVTDEHLAEEALGASEARFRTMVENNHDLYIVLDAEMRITWTNARLTETMGYSQAEVLGHLVTEYVHPDDVEAAVSELIEGMQGRLPTIPTIVRGKRKDGSWMWAEVVGPAEIAPDVIGGHLLCLRDATARKNAETELEAAERRFRALVQNSTDVVLVISLENTITYVSPGLLPMFGYPPEDVVTLDGMAFVHSDDMDRLMSHLPDLLADPGLQYEEACRVRRADGEWRWADLTVSNHLEDPAVQGIVVNIRDITDRHLAEEALRDSEKRFRALVEHSADAIVLLSADGTFEGIEPAGTLLGRPVDELIGRSSLSWLHPADQDSIAEALARIVSAPDTTTTTLSRVRAADGTWRWVEAALTNMLDEPAVGSVVANVRDITGRVEAEQSERRLIDIFEATDDYVGVFGPSGLILHLNAAARRLLGLGPHDPFPTLDITDLLSAPDTERMIADIFPKLTESGSWAGELEMLSSDGHVIPVLAQLLTHREDSDDGQFYSAVLRDISDRKAFEAELEHQATHDSLTGLPNRTLLIDRLGVALARAQRQGGTVGVLFLDLDHFKVVNDSRGHSLGDRLLAAIGDRLAVALRPGDTVARFGGDEFVVLCSDLRSVDEAVVVAERVLEVLEEAFVVGDTELFIGASIGISCAAAHSRATGSEDPRSHQAEDLIREADAAMYRAKERGRGRVAIFDESLRAGTVHRLDMENALRRAVDRGELVLHYQPIFDLTTGLARRVEALVRWQHPEHGLLLPAEFITLAEETGLIVPVGRWVLEHACHQLATWAADRADGEPLTMSVNLSGRQLGHPDLVDDLERVISTTGIDPGNLDLEVTESLLMDDVEFSHQTLAQLKHLGVNIAVDDFGTGYSSLSYLRSFPVDYLKVDRSFVAGLGRHDGDEAIVAAVIRLAHTLGLMAVAEGVETADQLARLQAMGCDLAQGFLLALPTPPTETCAVLDRSIFG